MIVFVLLVLVAIGGIFKSLADLSEEGKLDWKPCTYFSKHDSWGNKYKDVFSREPRFLGSTTVFVALTDFWHLANFISSGCYQLAISILLGDIMELQWWLFFILLKATAAFTGAITRMIL